MTDHFVVIGAGQAGIEVCDQLRKQGFEGHITLIGDEKSLPYQRPPLSKKYLLGEMEAERLLLRPADYYDDSNITTHLNKSVETIDRKAKTVTLQDGQVLNYDRLAITTGSRPRLMPESIGGTLKGLYPVRTLADVDQMNAEFKPGKKVLIVGGGYIGLEAAAVARKMGLEVTLIEMAPRILARVAAQDTSDYFMRLHAVMGVDIRTNTGLTRFEGTNRVEKAILSNGEVLDIDFALIGVGILPNSEIAEAAGLEMENGIKVDESALTSDPNIVSAGDCASFTYDGARIRLESVQNAIDQAAVAAAAMLGEKRIYVPIPWFWSDQYDIKLQITGLSTGFDITYIRAGTDEWSQSVWYYKEGTFIAVDAMNDARSFMLGKRWLQAGKSPDPAALVDPATNLKTL